MTVVSPCDTNEMRRATRAMLDFKGPIYMRTGRSDSKIVTEENADFKIGKGDILREGTDVTIVACGVQVARSLEASEILEKEGISSRVVNMHTIKPIDHELLEKCAHETGAFVTSEDHNILGGLGSAVAESISQRKPCPIEFNGVMDTFGESGEPDELAYKYKLTANFIADATREVLKRK
jgi:transketolase